MQPARSMFATVLRMLCVGSLLGLAQAASWAQVVLTGTVPSSRVSYSEGDQTSYIRYDITLRNDNRTYDARLRDISLTLTKGTFTGGALPGAGVIELVRNGSTFVTNIVAGQCSEVPATTTSITIRCTLTANAFVLPKWNGLKGTNPSLTFGFYVKAPSPSNTPAPFNGSCRSSECLTANAAASYFQNSNVATELKAQPLTGSVGVGSNRLRQSFSGAPRFVDSRSVFTKSNPNAFNTDPWSVTVTPTSSAPGTTVSIAETFVPKNSAFPTAPTTQICTNFVFLCLQAQITVTPPLGSSTTINPSNFLVFNFRSAGLNNLATTANSAQIWYIPDNTNAAVLSPVQVGYCLGANAPNNNNIPCVQNVFQDAITGEIVWTLYSYKNGGWRFL